MGICYSFAFVGNKCKEKSIESKNKCKIKCNIANEIQVNTGHKVLVTWFGKCINDWAMIERMRKRKVFETMRR